MSVDKGVKFGEYHSYDDLGLVLQPYTVPLPEPKLQYLDNSGGNGSIDVSEALGDICYNDRSITLTFTKIDKHREWEKIVSTVANAIHGRKMHVVFDRDPDYYYEARCAVSGITPVGALGTLTVILTCAPFKYAVTETVQTIALSSEFHQTYIECVRVPICPLIETNNKCTIEWGEKTITVDEGKHTVPSFRLTARRTVITIRPIDLPTSPGTVKFCKLTYRQGSL